VNLIEKYTRRDLGEPSDKLLAISAIAKRWGERSGDRYVAGLWMGSLGHGLFWYTDKCRSPLREYRAPSWSWASIESKVHFFPVVSDSVVILDVSVDTIPPDSPYSTVVAGHIALRGKCSYIFYNDDGISMTFRDSNGIRYWDVEVFAATYWDASDAEAHCLRRSMLVLKSGEEGLLLEEMTPSKYRRRGFISSRPLTFYNIVWTVKTVTII
jgi:hypothetical protein